MDERLHRLVLAAREHFDPPISKVSRVAPHAQLARALRGRATVENSLYATRYEAFLADHAANIPISRQESRNTPSPADALQPRLAAARLLTRMEGGSALWQRTCKLDRSWFGRMQFRAPRVEPGKPR